MTDLIKIASEWGDPRKQASEPMLDATPHGLTASQTEALKERFENFLPQLAERGQNRNRELFKDALPKGANWSVTPMPKVGQMLGGGSLPNQPGGGKTFFTQQRPYQPEFESPDRQQYPVHRILANRYWRLFYKLDPLVGNCIDMYGDMPWSDFKLTGPGVEGSVLRTMESMVEDSGLLTTLPAMVKEYFVVGEACPHLFFDDDKGYWTHIALHNPDQLEVIDAPFIKMDPIVQFIPDERLRSVLTSNNPQLRDVRESMPPALLAQLQARQNIPLSPINATFLPRKLHPYDTRGTSIFSRLWRIFMYEDAIFNASIQTARRHAGPLKIAKLGNAQTGWIPGPEHEAKLLQLLAQAEMDPHAWLVYHYGIAFETVGTTDRMMTIDKSYDIIERIKLVALGISKSFLHGEVTYASAATGLQVFLQRLKAMRSYFEQKWILPKYFQTMAEINGWIRSTPAEVSHHFRVKKSQRELLEEKRYIVPNIVWEKSLDPAVDANLINAMQVLESMGIKFAKTTKFATVGISFEEETRKAAKEAEFEKQFLPKIPSLQAPAQEGAAGGGMGMGGEPPPPPPPEGGEGGGAPPPEPGTSPGGEVAPPPPAPEPAALHKESASKDDKKQPKMKIEKKVEHSPDYSDNKILRSKIWVENKFGNWHADEVASLIQLFHTLDTDSPVWARMLGDEEFVQAVKNEDAIWAWERLTDFLEAENYPRKDIDELRRILVFENLLPKDFGDKAMEMEQDIIKDTDESDDGFLVGAGVKAAANKLGGPLAKLSGDIAERLREARKKHPITRK